MEAARRNRKQAHIERIRGDLGNKEALRRLFLYMWPFRTALLLGGLFTLLFSGLNIATSGLVALLLKVVKDSVLPNVNRVHSLQTLNVYAALAFLVFAARGVIYFGYNYTWAYVGQRLSMRLRNDVFAHLQQLPISFFDHRKTGQLMSAISSDIPAVTNVLDAIQDTISAPVMLVGGTLVLFITNWRLALLANTCLPATAWVILRATKRVKSFQGKVQSSLALVNEHAEETISGVRAVKSFGNEEYEIQRFNIRTGKVLNSVLSTLRIRYSTIPLVEYLGLVALILVVWVGGKQIIQHPHQYDLPRLVFFFLVLQQVGNGARNFGQISVNLTQAGVAADRVFTLLGVRNDLKDRPEALPLTNVQGRVVFDRVHFAYTHGLPVLANISFVMEPGEVVALVGPTGSGKTTIASLIPRFYDVSEGRIAIDGIDIRECQLKSLRDQIGIVPQETVLFAGTLRDNIAYGRLGSEEAAIIAAARMANAWEFIEKLPEGLDTVIGERGTRLSGGQRQRIAIARAVLRDPRILILDEATSSLDTQSEALVQDALQKLVADRTTLVIAHRLSTIRKADRILVIKDGHIVEAGRHSDLLRYGGIYSDLYQTQFREEDQTKTPLREEDDPVREEPLE